MGEPCPTFPLGVFGNVFRHALLSKIQSGRTSVRQVPSTLQGSSMVTECCQQEESRTTLETPLGMPVGSYHDPLTKLGSHYGWLRSLARILDSESKPRELSTMCTARCFLVMDAMSSASCRGLTFPTVVTTPLKCGLKQMLSPSCCFCQSILSHSRKIN